jgi:hypothetical protein
MKLSSLVKKMMRLETFMAGFDERNKILIKFLLENLKGRGNLKDFDIDGRIAL